MRLEKSSQEATRKLEYELNVYKLALEGRDTECNRLRKLQDEMVKENELLREQVKVTVAACTHGIGY